MIDSSSQSASDGVQTKSHDPAVDGLDELRYLLLSPERAELSELRRQVERVQHGAEDVSQVLPEAIGLRTQPDRLLTAALLPTIEEAVKVSVKKDPQTLVDAIAPVMGPSIRRAIAQALNGMIQGLNQALTYSLSFRGLKWRLEALRTGKSFAEVVLLHSLAYRVEQVFLIHKETGLLLQNVAIGSVIPDEPEVVSGMLTAIEDFVQDSFGAHADETLETFQVGELTVWVEQGPQAMIAAVIRGTPRHELHAVLQDALVAIHLEQRSALAAFATDTAPFAASQPHLDACLVSQTEEAAEKTSPFLWLLLAVCIGGLGMWLFVALRDNSRWSQYVQKLRAEPGIVVTQAEKRRGKYVISGLRDPLATEPMALLEGIALPPERVVSRWEPHQAFYPAFILTRAQQALQPPDTVKMRLENGILSATGAAPHAWILEARKLSRVIPGITHFQTDRLVDTDVRDMEAIKAVLNPPETVTLRLADGILFVTGTAPHAWILQARGRVEDLRRVSRLHTDRLVDLERQKLTVHKEQIERQVLRFLIDTAQLVPGEEEKLRQLLTDIQAFTDAAQTLEKRFRITILGHADQSGVVGKNMTLSQERADYVRTLLIARGLEATWISAAGVGPKAPLRAERTEQDRALNRSVSFRVILVDDLNG